MIVCSEYGANGDLDLPNSMCDGDAMQAALEGRGFCVTRCDNPDGRQMALALTSFHCKVRDHPGCIALVYFSGHGFHDQIDYIVPAESPDRAHPVPVPRVMRRLLETGDVIVIAVIDACRGDNHIPHMKCWDLDRCMTQRAAVRAPANRRNGASCACKGFNLSRTRRRDALHAADTQFLIAQACEPGTVAIASDSKSDMSPFTAALVSELPSGLPLPQLLNRVAANVYQRTGGHQVPTYYGSLGRLDRDLSKSDSEVPLIL